MKKCSIVLFILSLISCLMVVIFMPLNAEYSISYDLDGGTFETAYFEKYTAQDVIDIPVPSKKGYEFVGWTGSNGDTPQKSVKIFSTTGNKKYTANWELITYSITYNLSGGSLSQSNPTSYNVNSKIILNSPTRSGYYFLGWTGSNGSTPEKSITIPSGSTGNKTYTANWEYIQTYSITYNLNGGSVSGNPTSYNKFSNEITLNTPTRSGYYFLGWTGGNGSNPEKLVTISSGSTGNKTYTANWEYIQTYSITYNLNGGSVSGNPTSFNKYSSTIRLNNPTKTGYEFLGWTGSNGSTPEKSVTIYSSSTGDKTYTANWKAIKYTITYKLDGGENSESNIQEYTIETSFTFISPTKQYYTFMGWYKDTNFQSKINSISKGTIGDIVLYAKWELTKYTITYNLNGGINNKDNLTTFTVNDLPIKLSSPSLENTEFYGWKENNSNNNLTEISSCENYYLYATWGETYILSEDKTYYMVSGKSCSLKEVVINDSYNGLPVKSIVEEAFSGCSSLTSITIPNSVTSIGKSAFYNCDSLTSVYYIGTIENWCNITFSCYDSNPMYYTSQFYIKNSHEEYEELTEIEIPNTVTKINDCAFYGFKNVTKVTIPNSVTSIGSDAFYGCSSLQEMTMPFVGGSETETENTSLGYIFGASNYSENSNYVPLSLKKVTITKSIGDYAFKDCSNLTNITIQNSVTNIGDFAFSGCNSLQYNIYDNAKYLGNNENPYLVLVEAINTNITTCNINSNTRLIYADAFSDCSKLTSITIGDSVTSIGYLAFYGCSSLKYSTYDNAKYLGNNENPYLVLVEAINTNITTCTINSNTKVIYDSAFFDCSNLTSITIPNSVTSIGRYAFSNCSGLTSITIPNSVTSIGSFAFDCCYKLVEVYNLSSLNIKRGSVDNGYIGYYAKDISTSLDEQSKLKTSNGVVYYIIGTEKIAVAPKDKNATGIVLDDDCTKINQYAFYGCSSLTSITIPNSVTSIGNFAFYGCSSLTSITIPNSVTSIGWYAFLYCSSLSTVYYKGGESEWKTISIERGNDYLEKATIYYYSETKPTTAGNYWHYVDGVVKKWEVLI